MFVYVGAITASYIEPKPPLYLRPEPLPREGNMGEENEGIAVFHLDPSSGALTHLQAVRGLRNPSFLALHPKLPVLYAGERETTTWGPIEAIAGLMTSLSIGADGRLTLLSRQPSPGGATYVSIHPSGSHLFTAMPATGCVTVFPVEADGRVGPPTAMAQHSGRGVNTITLERPFPHSVRPDGPGKRILACDMGLDRIMVYDFNAETGQLTPSPHPYTQLSSGAGPRHLSVHPSNRFVYTVNEVDSTVSAFTYDAESSAMRIIATVSTRPEGFEGINTGAQIVVHPSGKFLYSSNRGHNSIAMFTIDQVTGRHQLIGFESSQGDTPRNFNIDPSGKFLLVANVGSSNLVNFRIDPEHGDLTPTGHSVKSPNPVCIMFRDGELDV
jgi:6-phosphogluconolactonase